MSKFVHIAHFDPPVHGEAIMSAYLRDAAASWDDIDYRSANAVFAVNRDDLGGFSVRKLFILASLGFTLLKERFFHRRDTVILHPAFFPGPFLKEASLVWLAWILGMRVICWVHMDPNRLKLESRPLVFRWLVLSTIRKVDTWLACAPTVAKNWPDWIPSARISSLTNGIEDPRKNHQPTRRTPGERLQVLYLSSMEVEKGWLELFRIAEKTCVERDDVEFHFCGGAGNLSNENAVRERFAGSSAPDRIQWHGSTWGDEKKSRFEQADLFVFPSHTEQFPIALLEAMAYGLPIVATDVGAVADALTDVDGGSIVPVNNPQILGEKIAEWLDHAERRAAAGAFNRRRFLEHFTVGNFLERWRNQLHN